MINKIDNLGYMIDVSRGAVPKLDSLKTLADILSAFGYDYLMLYTEDMFEVDGEPYFGYLRGRYSQKDIKELDQYCISKGIELIPCIQTLAHLEKLLVHHTYSNLFEIDNILLVGEDKVYNFIEKMISSCRKCFSSNKIHLGMDEAYKLGRGKYLDLHGNNNTDEIMNYHINRVNKIAEKYNFTKCYIWGDMVMSPNSKQVNYPDSLEPFLWYYHPLGNKGVDKKIKDFKNFSKTNIGFAGSATKYIGFAAANKFSNFVIKEQIQSCKKNDVNHYLLTAWGDGASDASMYSVLPSIFYTACLAKYGKFDLACKEKFRKIIGMSYDNYLKIDSIVNLDPTIDYRGKWNNVAFMLLYNDPFTNLMGDIDDKKYESLFRRSESILHRQSKNEKYGYVFESLSLLAKALSIKANIGNDLYFSYKNHEDLNKYIEQLNAFSKAFKKFTNAYEKQWSIENKSFGYEKQNIRFGGLINRTEFVINQIRKYSNHEISAIDELEETHLNNDLYFRPLEKDTDVVNVYENIVSPGALK